MEDPRSLGRPQRLVRLGAALLVVAGLVGALSTVLSAFPVGGRAYGVFLQNITLPLVAPINFGPTPVAQQPAGGGTDSASAGSINISGGVLGLTSILTAGPATVQTTGNAAANTSSSTATVNNLHLLTNLLSATTIAASCTLGPTGFQGSTTFAGVGSSVLGLPLAAFTNPSPNTIINVTGIGTIVLNEQKATDAGAMRLFEVNALRITLSTGILGVTGSVTVAHAECSGTRPTVTSISPNAGPTGTSVTISGANYLSPATVTIGGLAATAVSVIDANTITATVPAALPQGPWDVVVTTPIGGGTLAGGFTSTNSNPIVPVGGSSFGTRLSLLDALLSFLSLGPVPTVDVPVSTTPGDVTDTGIAVSVPGIPPLPAPFLNVGAFTVHTVTNPIAGTVDSSALSAGANVGGGLLAASAIGATCHFGPNGFSGAVNLAGLSSSLLGDLSAFVNAPPNTGLNIAGLGQITLNEQTDVTAAGVRRFTVNAIHVSIAPLGLSLGDLILGQATCAAAVPTALSLTPTTGTSAGGTTVTITGTNFALPATVTFGGVAAASVVVNSGTSITAVTPAHAAGNVAVVVGTPAGTATVPGGFTYVAFGGPTALSLTPTAGTTAGGTSVAITGTNFIAPVTVTFDGLPAASLTIDSPTQVTVTTPAHAAGNVAVVVTTLAGTAMVPGGYTYVTPTPGPTLTSIAPASGTTAGGTSTVITGTNLGGATSVTFDGVAAASFTVDSATQVTAVTPAHAAGNVAVVLTTGGGSASVPGGFTYIAPTPVPTTASITPTSGTTAGGTSTVISGTDLTGATSVTFDGVAASFTVDSATQITAVTPAHAAGNVAVVVTTPGGTASVPGGFTFTTPGPSAPTAVSITPASGTTAGGTSTVIAGTNLTGATSVTFDGIAAASFTVDSATQITAVTPAHAAGGVAVVITTPGGTASVPGGFVYIAPTPGPTLASIAPTSGTTAGGTSTVITGTNLTGATSVTFDGIAAASFTVDSATQITAVTPAHAAGNVAVVVTTGGGSASVPGGFTYTTPPGTPTASTIVPATGTTAGGTSTVITGTNLSGATSVTFDGIAAASFTVDSATQITAVTPAHGQANVPVTITTPGGTATVPGGFSYVAPGGGTPTPTSIAPASGTTAGGTTTVISGSNFTGATSVTFDGVAASFTVDNASQITATTPAHPATGNVVVAITTAGGTGTVPGGFTYTAAAAPNLTVTVDGPSSVSPGSTLVYTIHLTNTGGADANGAQVTAPALVGLTGPVVTGGGCTASPCTLNVAAGGSVDITATYTLPASYSGPDPISATFTATIAGDPTPGDNSVTVTTPVVPVSDISLLMTADSLTPTVGTTVTFTITATNGGPADATGIQIIDKLPVGLSYINATPSQGTYDPVTGRWNAGSLTGGASATLQLSANVDQAGQVTNTATRTGGDQVDPDSSDNVAALTLNGVASADVRVGMTASATSVPFGSPVSFTVTVTNVGPSPATGVAVTDLLPAALTFNTAIVSQGAYVSGTGVWTVGSLANGASATLVLSATVNATGQIINTATKTAQTGADPSPNTDTASVTINGTGADLQLVMTSTPAPAPPGATVTVDLTLTNLGPDGATGVGVVGAMPGGLIFVSATAEQGTYDQGTNFWSVGDMPASGPDGEARLRIIGIVPGGGVNGSSPTAQGDQADPNPLNNNPGPLPPSSGPVDLAASISMTGSFAAAGNPLTFTLGATNVGTGASVGEIGLQLALPSNVAVTSAPAGWNCSLVGQIYTCRRADLSIAPTQQVTAVVGATVTLAGSNTVPITLTVLYPPDQNLANNVASIPVAPGGDQADVAVTQTAAEAPRGTLTYHLTVTNNGPAIATGVTLTDNLPAQVTFSTTSPGSIACTGTTTVVCTIGTLASSASATVDIVATTTQSGPMTNTAVVTSGVPDSNNANNISSQTTTVLGPARTVCPGDSDCDGMTDECENRYGLNPNLDDSALDPDGDGLTNLQECTAGTHPRGFFTQLYAEGATGGFFDTEFSLVNTDRTHEAKVLVRMLLADGQVRPRYLTLAPLHRLALPASDVIGAGAYEFSTTVEADYAVASARTMRWDPADYGMSLGVGAKAAATSWYFAEGSTLGDFQLFFLVVNPSQTETAEVTATYLLLNGTTVVRPVSVPPHSRVTIGVKSIAGLEDTDVGAVFTSSIPVVVERSMYLNTGRVFEAGDAVTGVPTPATNWFIAEGANSAFFTYFLLLANPGTQPTVVTARYQLEDGSVVTKLYTLAATSRKTINVGLEDPALATAAVSTSLSATNPIIAERAMWWPGASISPRWYGGHQTMGSTQNGLRWALAAGSDGGPDDDRTFVLIANQNATPAQARVTVIFDDGTTAEKVLSLTATSRTTVNIGGDLPAAANRTFSVIVESIGTNPQPLSVDVSRYRSNPNQFWAAGGSSLGVTVP